MKKKMIVAGLALALGIVGYASFVGFEGSSKADRPENNHQMSQQDSNEMPTAYYGLTRYKIYNDLAEIKKTSPYIVIADYVAPKRTYTRDELVFTESTFHISKVMKGDQSLQNSEIIVSETGGISNGKKYTSEGNQLFDKGRYVLFLQKFDDRTVIPYDVYYVEGTTSGKFKLENGKVKAYGEDPLKDKATKLSESQILQEIENN